VSFILPRSVNFGRKGLTTVAWSINGGSSWFTSGVSESPVNSGIYKASITFPDGFSGKLDWKTGEGDATERYAAEDITPNGGASILDEIASDVSGFGVASASIVSGVIQDAAPEARSFVIALDDNADVPAGNNFVGLWLCFTSGDLAPAKQAITDYRRLTTKTAYIKVAVAFPSAPANGDQISII